MWLFLPSDFWIILLSEEASPKKRGRYVFIATFLVAFRAIPIPIIRVSVVTADPSTWRRMTYCAYVVIYLAFLGLEMKKIAAFRNRKLLLLDDRLIGYNPVKILFLERFLKKKEK